MHIDLLDFVFSYYITINFSVQKDNGDFQGQVTVGSYVLWMSDNTGYVALIYSVYVGVNSFNTVPF